jgi:hypothetical protein
MANPPSSNDLQRERVRFLNQSLSLQSIIKQGSIANSSRENILPVFTPTIPVLLTPTPSITPTISITPTVTKTPTKTPTPSVTPPTQGLLVSTTNQFTSFGASSAIYNSYFYKITNPYINYPFIDFSVNTGYLDVNNNSIIYYDDVNFSGWTVFNLNLLTAVCSASLPLNYIIPFSGWVGLSNDGDFSNFNNFSVTNVPVATPTPTIAITPSITPTISITLTITPTITPTISITPTITPTTSLAPVQLIVTTVSGVSANFLSLGLGLSGNGYLYPGYFKNAIGEYTSSYGEFAWYPHDTFFTGSSSCWAFFIQYDDPIETFWTFFWLAGVQYWPANTENTGPSGSIYPRSGRYYPLSAPDNIDGTNYINRDHTLAFDVSFDFTPLTPTPTPSITPTISLTPTITPSITPTISITPSITPTIPITPSITPTISITPSITPTISITPSITPTSNEGIPVSNTHIVLSNAILPGGGNYSGTYIKSIYDPTVWMLFFSNYTGLVSPLYANNPTGVWTLFNFDQSEPTYEVISGSSNPNYIPTIGWSISGMTVSIAPTPTPTPTVTQTKTPTI